MEFRKSAKGVCSGGFRAAGVKEGKYGVALIAADVLCECAGVFTKNSVKAAPVVLTRRMLGNGLQVVIANSGCANACVKEGLSDANAMAKVASKLLSIEPLNVGVASTGIIGKRLDLNVIESLAKKAAKRLSGKPAASVDAARAIMTTDTTLKQFSVEHNGLEVGGICKGAGMIAPNMATMLCFITTNACLPRANLQRALKSSVDKSFNMTVVDGDMSTNDTVLLLSSGRRRCNAGVFQKMLDCVTLNLARMIARDGEGASKYLEAEVKGARSVNDARKAAKAVVSSPLVKTAVYGENPNWGRVMSAIGSRVKFDPMNATIEFGSERGVARVFHRGAVGDLLKARKVLGGKDVKVKIDLRLGMGNATAFGCDLGEEYVRINAGYS
jgi:glutamate N-acetyltransferase/amino-acid N-acetyltransferase